MRNEGDCKFAFWTMFGGGVTFGLWRRDVFAGMFMFIAMLLAVMLIEQITDSSE